MICETSKISEIIVHGSDSIEHVLKTIDNALIKIALAIDEDGKLIGTITDGDIRRALLKQVPLSTPINEIMGRSPIVATSKMSKRQVASIMEANHVLHVPIVDETGRLINIATIHDVLQRPRFDNPVVLMAGGFGTRLRPLTDNCPKPLLKIGTKPILQQILESFVDCGFYRFYISTHYLPEQIRSHFGHGEKWNAEISYVHENEPLGTAGAIGLLPKKDINMPFILMNGDILTDVNFTNLLYFHMQQRSIATMCVREYQTQIPFGVIQHHEQFITDITEKPIYKQFVNAGIYVLDPSLLLQVPENSQIDMPTLLQRQIAASEKVAMYPIHENWLDVGRLDDFNKAQEIFG